ncbi:MAG: putative DNA-binding domain-containing protein [Pseudomonas sp.]
MRQTLTAFAAHLRDPAGAPAPAGIDPRRLQVYRRLYANNLEALLAGNFPVLRRTLDDAAWRRLLDGFARDHRARSPLFTEIGQEFIDYLTGLDPASLPPWLLELAHYEWIELELQLDDTVPAPHAPDGDLLAGIPVLSPSIRVLGYHWPVHRIGPDFQPDTPPPVPTWLLAHRDAARVRFAELSALTARLLELLGEPDAGSGAQVLARLADEARPGDRDAFLDEGAQLLLRLHRQGTILGCATPLP